MAGGTWKQGKYELKNQSKYVGTLPIFYRSSWEHRVFHFLDTNPAIIQWASESIIIPYKCQIDNKIHRYYVDVNFIVNENSGIQKRYLVEIKPYNQTIPPKMPSKKTPKAVQRYNQNLLTFQKNYDKWTYAKVWAEKNGYIFDIWTEKTLGLGD
jgi:hypothetical protein